MRADALMVGMIKPSVGNKDCTVNAARGQEEQKAANRSLQGQDEAFEQDKGNKCEGSV